MREWKFRGQVPVGDLASPISLEIGSLYHLGAGTRWEIVKLQPVATVPLRAPDGREAIYQSFL